MLNFTYSIPTVVHFGKGQISHLSELGAVGKKVLMVYGGGSIKRAGIYDAAIKLLTDAGVTVFELPGVEPNPRIQSVRKGAEICKAENIDMVLAIGGGSTIDCAKVVAAGAKYDGDAWDLVLNSNLIQSALPIYTVLTLATAAACMKPVMSVLDPEYTYSVSKKQTAAGTADMISHIFENYFTPVQGADVQARFCEGLLKTAFHYGPIAMDEPTNYDARANLMWTASFAINGLLSDGADVKWCVHPMEHELSAFYDVTHGEGLAVLTPFWMDHVLSPATEAKFAEYGRNVWNLTGDDAAVAKASIECTRNFFKQLGLPATLTDLGIDETHFDEMARKASKGLQNAYVPLTKEDVLAIFKAAL
ncbi:MAG: iron-containing alcohol dehydrogenase [Eubacteriales bacterium]|nr:iron-containing alcohol dehydrogenase [Eubacteriales bacterium]